MNTKNIIVIGIAILIAVGAWATSSWVLAPHRAPSLSETASSTPEKIVPIIVTTTDTTAQTQKVPKNTASSTATAVPPQKPSAPRIMVSKSLFNYDITPGKTPCNDKIGTFDVTSSDPSKQLYWGMTGAKPIWLTFSTVEGSTPATVNMYYNCIMSGAEDTIDWNFTVVEMTKEGKYVDGYYRSVALKGDIKK